MSELLDSPLLPPAIAIIVLVVIGRFVYGLLNRPKPAGVFLKVACRACGWRGTVGKYNRKCSACGSTSLKEAG